MNLPYVRVYDSATALSRRTLEDLADVPPSTRCINCGGYAMPDSAVGDASSGCSCEGDYRPTWKAASDELARRDTRYALVTGCRSRQHTAAYLPANYALVGSWPVDGGVGYVIAGRDVAGWTLDGYVIPRYASGLIGCVEITADEADRMSP